MLVTSTRLRYLQVQCALAGVYQRGRLSLWAGPFLDYVQGELDLKTRYTVNSAPVGGVTCPGDLDDDVRLGIHLGGSLQGQGATYRVTGQFTGDSWLLGLGAMCKIR